LTKNLIKILFYLFLVIFSFSGVHAKNQSDSRDSRVKNLGSPNWVHPSLRKNYKGYEKRKLQKQSSSVWQHSTNRPSGNIKGGGTTQYKDYTPFYTPSQNSK